MQIRRRRELHEKKGGGKETFSSTDHIKLDVCLRVSVLRPFSFFFSSFFPSPQSLRLDFQAASEYSFVWHGPYEPTESAREFLARIDFQFSSHYCIPPIQRHAASARQSYVMRTSCRSRSTLSLCVSSLVWVQRGGPPLVRAGTVVVVKLPCVCIWFRFSNLKHEWLLAF